MTNMMQIISTGEKSWHGLAWRVDDRQELMKDEFLEAKSEFQILGHVFLYMQLKGNFLSDWSRQPAREAQNTSTYRNSHTFKTVQIHKFFAAPCRFFDSEKQYLTHFDFFQPQGRQERIDGDDQIQNGENGK